ncbi:Uncharacterised protein [Actinomyces bovis]|uniref:Uncharacterized protein n=1 Tax=Actinomyces bovis TaxID=1658 RepID=A0ABY1VNV8_9ACTO|nr:hypothetical protein [Actinomyces bovis]SPT53096.1 Uncharacterised protein [Actinomyces bovis]SPT53806.1 Uncharacterised protein [Actinomyces bovis]VEG53169.1 Uncharacterised protein [Actinomyces israelii]
MNDTVAEQAEQINADLVIESLAREISSLATRLALAEARLQQAQQNQQS